MCETRAIVIDMNYLSRYWKLRMRSLLPSIYKKKTNYNIFHRIMEMYNVQLTLNQSFFFFVDYQRMPTLFELIKK